MLESLFFFQLAGETVEYVICKFNRVSKEHIGPAEFHDGFHLRFLLGAVTLGGAVRAKTFISAVRTAVEPHVRVIFEFSAVAA